LLFVFEGSRSPAHSNPFDIFDDSPFAPSSSEHDHGVDLGRDSDSSGVPMVHPEDALIFDEIDDFQVDSDGDPTDVDAVVDNVLANGIPGIDGGPEQEIEVVPQPTEATSSSSRSFSRGPVIDSNASLTMQVKGGTLKYYRTAQLLVGLCNRDGHKGKCVLTRACRYALRSAREWQGKPLAGIVAWLADDTEHLPPYHVHLDVPTLERRLEVRKQVATDVAFEKFIAKEVGDDPCFEPGEF